MAPYQGLNMLFQEVSRELITDKNIRQPLFDFIRFDRKDDITIITDALQTNYDLIISRGGTATLLKKMTKVPIIDIGVSQYDLLSTIQTASRLSKVAIVAFAAFTQRVKAVLKSFNLKTPIYEIAHENELPDLLRTLSGQDISTLICDTSTEASAKSAKFTTLLITTSKESVINAFRNGLNFLNQMDTQRELADALANTLDNLNIPTITMTSQQLPLFSSKLLTKDESLEKSVLRAIHNGRNHFALNTVRYKLTPYQNGNLTVYTIGKWGSPQKRDETDELSLPMDPALKDAFASYFKLTQPPVFFNLIQSYSRLNRPVLIIGALGSGKNYIADLLHAEGLQSAHPIHHLDMGKADAFNKLMNQSNSPLYGTNQCFVFEGLNRANAITQRNLVEFTIQTQLASRNQVIFTFKQSPDDGISTEIKPLLDYARTLTLDSFQNVTGAKIVQLLTGMINTYNREHGTSIMGVSDIALDFILNESWPENFIQFYQVLNIAMASTLQDYIGIDEIRMALATDQKNRFIQNHQPTKEISSLPQGKTLSDMVQEIVVRTLAANNNNRTKTAKVLGISRATLWRYLKQA